VDFLDKLRNKPRYIRKIILWVTVIIVALILGSWWIFNFYWKIKKFPKEEIKKEIWQKIPKTIE